MSTLAPGPAQLCLNLTDIDTDKLSDLREGQTTTTHLPDQRLQTTKVTGPALYGISTDVLRRLVKTLALP
ncbi:hypothetical protein AU195_00805 [Mycobacterium sp. IS-1496]|uniref:Uncharacterized protein n=1 Tax=Mycolicibacterium chitae TaxID=1792 RepID=A0A448I1B1_MYCCI|nr:hypothetical protein AU185_19860 [Mycobacterium sp. GA-0227b]KUH92106.1 hypothetical protein AU186_06575 [Mycobacterium sp. GA-1999]KUI30291.1 hypothetical protein AU195_00805 [Mycobacterium sp. IS-1496]MCV7174735.1 hypothetical protein [Mycolicibacterium sphagni]OBA88274.1 hypothetical protein A5633_09205 [Mycolicibacterium elephantis]OBG82134.1 hypothetical protein A5699_07040 [Mycobacterium sp. E802]CRL76263.1 hypothetical protein CPGR_03904 [Mycolicibacterium malmesburyense]VEG46133.1